MRSLATALSGVAALISACAAQAGPLKALYAFKGGQDGVLPFELVSHGDTLYGTTDFGGGGGCIGGCGTVFMLQEGQRVDTVLYRFQGAADGQNPMPGMVVRQHALIGATNGGGSMNRGALFRIDTVTGAKSTMFDFPGGDGPAYPLVGPIEGPDGLFGTSASGGVGCARYGGCGTVFTVTGALAAPMVIYAFHGGNGGRSPATSLIYRDGMLYGTTQAGGAANAGLIFRIDTNTGRATVLHNFTGGGDGAFPYALMYQGGMLYGTTGGGGTGCAGGCGTVYRLDMSTGDMTTLYAFSGGADGKTPAAGVTFYAGALYGTTQSGGAAQLGTAFKIDINTQAETVLHSFTGGMDGANPASRLVMKGGMLYGTAQAGGVVNANCPAGCGTIFEMAP